MRKFLFFLVCVNLLTFTTLSIFAYTDITPQDAKKRIDAGENVFFMDVRQPEEYATGYAPNAVLIPLGEVAQRLNEIPQDKSIFVICKAGGRSAQASKILDDNGFKNVFNILGGTSAWQELPSYLYITPKDLKAQIDDANKFIVDVRSSDDYSALHIARAASIPIDKIKDQLGNIPIDKEIIVIAEDNKQGNIASETLILAGYKNVKNMDGGMTSWAFETSVFNKGKILTTFGIIKTKI